MTTVLLPPADFAGSAATLEGDAHHHLFRVRRLRAGDRLRVVDGLGAARSAIVASVERTSARLELGEAAPANEAPVEVELDVAPPEPSRAAWLVEKATELGVTEIRFLATERGARAFGAGQIERLRRVAAAALEQCEGSRLPAIEGPAPLAAALERGRASRARLLALDVEETAATEPFPRGEPLAPRVALFVGPEGGWSDGERSLFAAAGVPRFSLGRRTLRIETAALAAVALALSRSR